MPTTTQHDSSGRFTADDDLAFAGLTRLGELLTRGQVTPRELTEFYLQRIERLDPFLGAFISVRAERALTEADAAHERLRAGERGPLLGIPIAIKDNVNLAGEVTTHGNGGPHQPAPADSEVVRRLRAAGAIVLGKTALCPASIPAGFDTDGLPMAIQLAGPPNSDTTIVSLAAQIEAAPPWHERRPTFMTEHDSRPGDR